MDYVNIQFVIPPFSKVTKVSQDQSRKPSYAGRRTELLQQRQRFGIPGHYERRKPMKKKQLAPRLSCFLVCRGIF